VWRPQDEALLARIEDELIIEQLWQLEAPGQAPLHGRASGLVGALRLSRAAEVERAAQSLDDRDVLRRLVRPRRFVGLSPQLLHHLAVFHARVAEARGSSAEGFTARLLSLAAWLALASEGSYLQRLATAVYGEQYAGDAAWEQLTREIQALSNKARAGARSLADGGRTAMKVLARISEACRLSGCTVALQKRVEAAADRERSRVVDHALGPISEAIADAAARGKADAEGGALMDQLVRVWQWSDWDEHVERYAVDEITPVAWNIYQIEDGWDGLRRLLSPLEPLVDNLARRVEDDNQRIAYAAPVAQMYVFRSEMATELDVQMKWAERSVAMCPTHRNGRLILARVLCNEVSSKLDQGITAMMERDELLKKLQRAHDLWPSNENIEPLRVRVERLHFWKN
jgi:hypothetical protein